MNTLAVMCMALTSANPLPHAAPGDALLDARRDVEKLPPPVGVEPEFFAVAFHSYRAGTFEPRTGSMLVT